MSSSGQATMDRSLQWLVSDLISATGLLFIETKVV